MNNFNIFFIQCIMYTVHGKSQNQFPDYFKFGVGTSAYQAEGAWNVSGKGESIWDRFTHEHPEIIMDHSNGDVASDSYHLWKTDVENLKELGVDFYRLSLSWTRILPTGLTYRVNSDGVEYYNNLIDSLLANGIEPVVTLYEWDLPQKLQDLGGWTSLQTAEYFANFARLAFRLFGDRVKTWITISEPFNICEISYGQLSAPPLINSPGVGDYLCGKTVLIAHSKAYHIYDKEFRKRQKGKIGIVLDTFWPEPKTNRTEDIKAVDRVLQMRLGWFANPIFSKDGDYPEIMKKTIENRSVLENFAHSRLPPFTQTEIKDLKGSSDFFGLNHYYTSYFENLEHPIGESSFIKDAGISSSDFENSYGPKNRTVPWGFYRLLHWVANKYNNPLVYITEIGYHDDGRTDDTDRIVFHAKFLKALLHAIKEGCNVQRYTVWTFIDMFAWTLGYSAKFGLYKVDFDSPNRTRTPKASAYFYKNVIKNRVVPNDIF